MYQALRSLGVETQLVIYPNENHRITRPSYQRDRLERYLAWYGALEAIGIVPGDWWRDRMQGGQEDAFTTSEFGVPGAPSADEPPAAKQPVFVNMKGAQGEQQEMMGRIDNGKRSWAPVPSAAYSWSMPKVPEVPCVGI